MLVLGIESTCDETGCSIVRDGKEILSNIVTSQIDLHEEFGGVVPELACRRHVDVMLPVIDEAIKQAGVSLEDIDLIAVANGPGLIGAILIGLHAAKGLALALEKPIIGVNHIEAHLYAALMSEETPVEYPCLGAIFSGGHTSLVIMHSPNKFTNVSRTVDDAVGEAFDKVAKIMRLPYPGGPKIEVLAKQGNPHKFPFKAGNVKGRPLDFSFSGLKTSVLYSIRGQNCSNDLSILSDVEKCDIAASFQQTAFADIVKKTLAAAKEHNCSTIVFGGGVTNNQRLRDMFSESAVDIRLAWPTKNLSLDNAAMIAGLGYHLYKENPQGDSFNLEAFTRS